MGKSLQDYTAEERKEVLQIRLEQELMTSFDLFYDANSHFGQKILENRIKNLKGMQEIINNISKPAEPKKQKWKKVKTWFSVHFPWLFWLCQKIFG